MWDSVVVAQCKLTVAATVAEGCDDESAVEVVPVTFDVFTQVDDTPVDGACAADGAFVSVPKIEVERGGGASLGYDGEVVGGAQFVLAHGAESAASHDESGGSADALVGDGLGVEF